MKTHRLIALCSLLCLNACIYDAPLVGEATLPIDPALLGSWEFIPEDAASAETPERLVIRKKSANVYAIEHISDDSTFYFDAWLAELEGIRFVQLEATGDNEGPVTAEDTDLFAVYSWAMEGGELVVKTLNADLLPPDIEGTAALQAAFAEHRDNPDLFDNPGRLSRLTGL